MSDPIGQRFGMWTVLGGRTIRKSLTAFSCRCDCGTERTVALSHMARGLSTNCGCIRSAKAKQSSPNKGTHRSSKTPEYVVWKGALARCHNPKATGYDRYGARGIVMCERWRLDFFAFLKDMGPRPVGTTLERIDNDGIYEPGNCKWATRFEQGRNKRTNVNIKIDGVTKCMSEWCAHFGINKSVAQKRISDMGWSPADAVSRPVRKMGACY